MTEKRAEHRPCRLHFLLARQAPIGVLFRRGPTRWVRIIKWNVAEDTFEPGQWFNGRIYEKRSDLSPDGTKLVYFAQKINRKTLEDREYTYAWTAVSRPPFLTALALWPKGDCWNGGGLFESDTHLWLNHYPSEGQPHADHPPGTLQVSYNEISRGEDHTVLAPRLTRDGWPLLQSWHGRFIDSPLALAYKKLMDQGLSMEEQIKESLRLKLHELSAACGYVTDIPELREKSSPDGRFVLQMRMDVDGFRRTYAFSLRDAAGRTTSLGDAEWADWDQRGRLAFARGGKLWAAEPVSAADLRIRELADFDPQKPAPVKCPEWARKW